MNVVDILNEQIAASKGIKPRRKMQESREMHEVSAGSGHGDMASTPTTQRTSRKRGLKGVQKIVRRQQIAPYRKRKSLLPYFNINIHKAPKAPSLVALPAVTIPDPEPAPVQYPAAVGGSNTPGVSIDSSAPLENQQSGAASLDIFSIMRINLNNICHGEFGTQDAPSETIQAQPEADNHSNSDVDIFDCLSNRLYNGWNN
ncbi:hypothetical protein ACLKA7_002873 [Drosophila subpalustris]